MATGVPVTFDFHHHRFCRGGLTEEQAFKTAIATWPKGVRPQVTPPSLFLPVQCFQIKPCPNHSSHLLPRPYHSSHLVQLVAHTICREDVRVSSQHSSCCCSLHTIVSMIVRLEAQLRHLMITRFSASAFFWLSVLKDSA